MCGCGGCNYSKSKCGQAGTASTCGQMPKNTSSCVPTQKASAYQQVPKSTPMTTEAAQHIQSNTDKTGINPEPKAAAENLDVEEERQKEKEFAMSH